MADANNTLYEVEVRGPSGASWRILIRAVDEESAIGVARARGNHVLGVRLAGPAPKRAPRRARITCENCGYPLTSLTPGTADEVRCPECGWVNVPEAGGAAGAVAPLVRRRGRRVRWVWGLMWLLVVAGLVGCALAFVYVRGSLRAIGVP